MRPQFSLKVAVIIVPLCVAAGGLVAHIWVEPTFGHSDYQGVVSGSQRYRYWIVQRKEWTGKSSTWNVVAMPSPYDFGIRIGSTDLGDHRTTLDVAAGKVYLRGEVIPFSSHPCVVLIDRKGEKWETPVLSDAEREQLLSINPQEWPSLPFWKSKVEDRLFQH